VLYALGIRYVGETVAKKLASRVQSVDQLKVMTQEELEAIDEIGTKIAESIVTWFSEPGHIEMIEFLKGQGLRFQLSESRLSNRSEKLKGLSIVISGTFEKHSRDELKELIEQNGEKMQVQFQKKHLMYLPGITWAPANGRRQNNWVYRLLRKMIFLN
jgi:DNA ligase (NAD+)